MTLRFIALATAVALTVAAPLPLSAQPGTITCEPQGALVRVAGLHEGSGIAASRRTPGRFWVHNDSSEPVLLALDTRGAVTTTLRISGAQVEDWEAVTVGTCGSGSCLFIGDIGDNDARRKRITIYRVQEPDASRTTATAEAIHATYPDGAHDAEALFASPDGQLFIVTKGETGARALYRFPRELKSGATVALERVGKGTQVDKAGRITDGAMSSDGKWVVLRSNRTLHFYAADDLLAGNWREAGRVDLGAIGEPQGEGVAFGDKTTVYLAGEGGGKSQPGTFARLACRL